MTMQVIRATLPVLATLLAACNPALRQPATTEPHALLLTQRPASGAITYMAFDNAECRNGDGLGFIGALGDLGAKTKTYRLPTGKPIFLHASSSRLTGSSGTGDGGTRFNVGTCSELVRFTPQDAHEYRVTIDESCRVTLIDTKTNAPPEGLQGQKAPQGCGG
jgi:hypothetical protein